MYEIIVFKEIIQVIGDKSLTTVLETLSKNEDWKKIFPTPVSAGYHVDKTSGNVIHYLKRAVLCNLAQYFYDIDKSFQVRGAGSNEYSPIESFETWDPPGNQENAITTGYLDCPDDYHFIVPYYHRNAFGAWREMPPVI